MQRRAPRVCLIYFSLSGQSRGLINLFADGLRSRGVEVLIERIKTNARIGFPFGSILRTLKMMWITFCRKRFPILPLSAACYQPCDLYVLAGPTWSYNPSGPLLDLLDRYGERLFMDRPVLPLISCRGYYRMHERYLRKRLERCGARPQESLVFRHPVQEPWSTIGVFLRSAGYHPERLPVLAGHYRHFGHSVEQLGQAREEGRRLGESLQQALNGDAV